VSGATTLGSALRAERLRQGRELAEITARTKICGDILEAIENDQFDCIPGGAYRSSFLRQYARVLGLDEEATVAAFRQQYVEPPLPLPAVPKESRWRHFSGLARLLAFLAVAAGVYRFAQKGLIRPDWSQAVVTLGPTANVTPGPAGNLTPLAAKATVTPPVASANVPPQPEVGQATASRAARFTVAFTATEPVWLSVKCDGNQSYTGTLTGLESKAFEADGVVTVLIGNAGGVAISLNGKPVGPIGAHGETQFLELTPGGARRLPHGPSQADDPGPTDDPGTPKT